ARLIDDSSLSRTALSRYSDAGLLRPVGLKPPWRSNARTASRTASSLRSGAAAPSARSANNSGGAGGSPSGRGNSVTNARRSNSGCGSTVSMPWSLLGFRFRREGLEFLFQRLQRGLGGLQRRLIRLELALGQVAFLDHALRPGDAIFPHLHVGPCLKHQALDLLRAFGAKPLGPLEDVRRLGRDRFPPLVAERVQPRGQVLLSQLEHLLLGQDAILPLDHKLGPRLRRPDDGRRADRQTEREEQESPWNCVAHGA